jgi:hypothetical protein
MKNFTDTLIDEYTDILCESDVDDKPVRHGKLSNKKGSYIEQLIAHNKEIERAYNDRAVSVSQLKELVKRIVLGTTPQDEAHKSAATKRFLIMLARQKSKSGIIQLVWNSRLKGDNLGVI